MFFKVYGTNFISAHVFGFVEGTLRSEQALLEVALSLSLKGEERGGREREKEEGERGGRQREDREGERGGREGGRGRKRGREGGREAIILCYLNPVCHSHSCPAPHPQLRRGQVFTVCAYT